MRNLTVIRSKITRTVRVMPYFDRAAQPGPVIDFQLGDPRAALIRDRRNKAMHFAVKL